VSILTEWLIPPAALDLSDEVVHVWRARLALEPEVLARLRLTLSPTELARAERFVLDRDRERFVAAHGVLRNVLSKYLHCAPQTVEFSHGPFGKPAVSAGREQPSLRFNLSHSCDLALIALGRKREVGIDLERVRSHFGGEEIAKRYFSPIEVSELRTVPSNLQSEAFFLCWTRKEAYIKATGKGLQTPLDGFTVSLTPGAPAELKSADESSWTLRSLSPEAGYAAAVVAEGKGWLLRCFSWSP